MGKVLKNLGKLIKYAEYLDDMLAIVARVANAKAAIQAAKSGTIVPCGTVKRIKAFGRYLDLTLNPIVRD